MFLYLHCVYEDPSLKCYWWKKHTVHCLTDELLLILNQVLESQLSAMLEAKATLNVLENVIWMFRSYFGIN